MKRNLLLLAVFIPLFLSLYQSIISQSGATFITTTTLDTIDANVGDGICADSTGECSLRAAIMEANFDNQTDNIQLSAGTYNINLDDGVESDLSLTGDLDIRQSVNIIGAGSTNTILTGAQTIFHILTSDSILTVNLDGVRLTDDDNSIQGIFVEQQSFTTTLNITNSQFDHLQRAIYNESGTINITDSTFNNNGNDAGAALYSYSGHLRVTGSTFMNNNSDSNGGAMFAEDVVTIFINSSTISNNTASLEGGAIYFNNSINNNQFSITNTTIDNNHAKNGGGLYLAGGRYTSIRYSTLSNNVAEPDQANDGGEGGAIYFRTRSRTISYVISLMQSTINNNEARLGGGLYLSPTIDPNTYLNTNLNNITISGNVASENGGGIWQGRSFIALNNTTVTNNHADMQGGGLFNAGFLINYTRFSNTILAGNTASVSAPDCYDQNTGVDSYGHNLLGNNDDCPNFDGSGDIINVDAMLDVLADNGGFSQTHALQEGSPAINAGGANNCFTGDQRNFPRNGICDIGAYEFDAGNATVTATATTTNTPTRTATADPDATITPWLTSTAPTRTIPRPTDVPTDNEGATMTPSFTPSNTNTPDPASPTPSFTPSKTNTPDPASLTPSRTPSKTNTPDPASLTPSFTPSVTPTNNPDAPINIIRIAPAANAVLTDYISKFQWVPVEGMTWYHLYISTPDFSQVFFDKWYLASEVCDNQVCTTPDEIWLVGNGEFAWWMSYWNESIGDNYINLYSESRFTLSIPAPGMVNTGTHHNGLITWDAEPSALWYQAWVGPADYSSTIYVNWLNGEGICLDGLCSIDVGILPAGNYEFWLQTWNPVGLQDWHRVLQFTAP